MASFITHRLLKNASDERGTGRVSTDELQSPSANPHSQTTTVRSKLMVSHQSFSQWQQSPQQGTIPARSPFAPADESYLQEVLTECRVRLEFALTTAQRYSRLSDL